MLMVLLVHIYIVPTCSKTWSVAYIAEYDMQLHVLLLYYLVPICRKLTVIYRQLGNNHLIQLLWVVSIHLKLGITSATLGSKT